MYVEYRGANLAMGALHLYLKGYSRWRVEDSIISSLLRKLDQFEKGCTDSAQST
jgi:hypothetical protein